MDTPDGYRKLSLTIEEIALFKRELIGDFPFVDRVSVGFAYQLHEWDKLFGEFHDIVDEIQALELASATPTKKATQFKYEPLYPLWHKHFSTHRHLLRNLGERWNISRGGGNKDAEKMMHQIASKYGSEMGTLINALVHRFVIGGLEERSSSGRMTGDWIIFAKHEGKNYYLDLATHQEGADGSALMERIKATSEFEFPFLFLDQGGG